MTDSEAQRTNEALTRADVLERSGDLSGAIAELSAAIAIDPTNAGQRAHRGRLLHLREDWQEALQDFDAALFARRNAGAGSISLKQRTRRMASGWFLFGALEGADGA